MAKPPPSPIVDFARWASGRPQASVRILSPEKARYMNVPNAMVDAVPTKGRPNKLRASRYMFVPQSIGQAFDSLIKDTGVTWPEETQALSLMTLLHEARHLRNGKYWQSERRAQAWALGHYMQAANRIGVDPEKAARMYQYVQKYTQSLPPDYRPRTRP